jgi:predicted secreted acid phosphatase
MDALKGEFGNSFIVLPNPMYGNWPGSIGIRNSGDMDSLILEMTKTFQSY